MERSIIESCIKRRIPLPEKIANAPRILKGLEGFYIAFWELSTDRQSGMGAGPIPWTAINLYCQREGVTGEDYDYLLDMVRAMDRVFLDYQKEKSDEREAAAKAAREGPISQKRMVGR